MKTSAAPSRAVRQTPSESGTPGHADAARSRQVSSILSLQRRVGNQAVRRSLQESLDALRAGEPAAAPPGRDAGRAPALPEGVRHRPSVRRQAASPVEGESVRPEREIEAESTRRMGEGEYPVDFVGPLQPGDTYAVPHDHPGAVPAGATRSSSFHPTMTVTTPGTPTGDCGGYTYTVRWGIPASEATSAGWVVQKVRKTFEATDCDGNPVTPRPIDVVANYPFWEAWEFTAGQNVWAGPESAGTTHSGDTFGGSDYGPGTRGRKVITGEVKAIVGFVPPTGMTVRNTSPAWILPYTRTEPPQFANTLPGAAHTLTAEWNCCPNGTVTRATTVTTNP
jgi:hypothetical protein